MCGHQSLLLTARVLGGVRVRPIGLLSAFLNTRSRLQEVKHCSLSRINGVRTGRKGDDAAGALQAAYP